MMCMVEKTRLLTKNYQSSHILISVVPFSVVRQFGLVEFDEFEWSVDTVEGELIIKLKPIKARKEDEE